MLKEEHGHYELVLFTLLLAQVITNSLSLCESQETNTHIVSQRDIGSAGEQHADHLNVLMFGSPDNGGPTPAVLK